MDLAKLNDQEIVEIIQSGGPRAKDRILAILYKQEKWRRTIRKLILNHPSGTEEDVVDVLHEGFAQFEENVRLYKFRGESKLETYLISICKIKWLKKKEQHLRLLKLKEKLSQENSQDSFQLQTQLEMEENKNRGEERKKRLHLLIEQLGEKCKAYLDLYMQDFTPQQIAEITDLKNETQARKATYKCRMRLRKLILEDPQLVHFFKSNVQ